MDKLSFDKLFIYDSARMSEPSVRGFGQSLFGSVPKIFENMDRVILDRSGNHGPVTDFTTNISDHETERSI